MEISMLRLALPALLGLCLMESATLRADEELVSVADKATHRQSQIIQLQDAGTPINAFCLDREGHIVAAIGSGPGKIVVADDSGTVLRGWDISARPESISTAADGSVLVGGEGRLFRFAADGKLLAEAESPHMNALKVDRAVIREQAIAQLKAMNSRSPADIIPVYENMLKQLETKAEEKDLNTSEQRTLDLLPQMIAQLKERAEKEKPKDPEAEPSELDIQTTIQSLVSRKTKISSVSSNGSDVFVATPSLEGYGYDVWKTAHDFSGGAIIVTGLRGCCGQMDVQACEKGIYVAENARHRVVYYDAEGKEAGQWGERDRTGVNGFTSCCNPMNVCFGAGGDVFTAESNTGRIKRFTAAGEFVSYVGDVELVPGCKNVSIAVSPKTDRVYMLDLTRNHIVLMTAADSKPDASPVPVEAVSQTSKGE
jgi:hypothetical protein